MKDRSGRAASGTRRQLTDQGRERKEQLLDRARELFSARGYADTRIADICESAGVAKGLFYWYFENKEALFAELVVQMRQRLRRAQADAMDPEADPLVRLRQGAEASVHFMSAHATYFALLETENREHRFSDLMSKGAEIYASDVMRLVREGMELGLIREEDPVLLAHTVTGTVAYASHLHRHGRVDADVSSVARFVGRSVVHLVAADDEIARRACLG
jgi:AcrR family transcriptional regulator